MEILVTWLILGAVVGFIAAQRGRSGMGFFALSVLLSPLIGIVVLLATPGPSKSTAETERRGPCWQCKEMVMVGASRCRFCGADLTWPNESTAPPPA